MMYEMMVFKKYSLCRSSANRPVIFSTVTQSSGARAVACEKNFMDGDMLFSSGWHNWFGLWWG